MSLPTTHLIDCSNAVSRFITEVDSVVSDLSWKPEVWIEAYNLFYNDKHCDIQDILTWYNDHVPLNTGKLDNQVRDRLEKDRYEMACLAVNELYPLMHLKLAYSEDDRPYVKSVHYKVLKNGRIECLVLISE